MLFTAFRYFATIFALAFLLGTIRTLWLAPAIGATSAVLVELSIVLIANGIVARRLVTHPRLMRAETALAIGALAFVMLMAAEALLAVALFGRSFVGWIGDLFHRPGWIGLAGQMLFGLMPWLAVTVGSPRRRGALPPHER